MKTQSKPSIAILISFIGLVFTASSPAESKYRDFLLKDGRSFRGRIVAYDQHSKVVSLERADKRLIKTDPGIFDKADQIHIEEWNMIQHFRSERWLKISVDRKKFGPFNLRYTISFENNSGIVLPDMQIDTCIFYTQKHQKYGERKWIIEEGVTCGSACLPPLKPNSKPEQITADLSETKNLLWTFNLRFKPMDIHGIWIRITLPLSNGRNIVRDECLPGHLIKHQTWTSSTIPAGVIKHLKRTPTR